VTGTRAEYGLLRWVMEEIRSDPDLELQLVVTGMHLSPEFGSTYRDIENDGFSIDHKVEMLLSSDTPVAISKSMGLGLIGFGEALQELSPDLLVVLGDRFEIFSAVSAAMILKIPVAHLHGGETTEGAFDESIRHSITKMSHLHFVATEEYRNRVIQLGENPANVFLVGGLGVDSIQKLELLDRAALEESLGFKFGDKSLLVTHHPETLDSGNPGQQMSELLAALDHLDDTQLIFTMPNADTDSRVIIDTINDYVKSHQNAVAFKSLGQIRYFSCIKFVDGVVGNSSSGLTEVPSFAKGTVNIGDRQKGRLRAKSVIDCGADRASILAGLKQLYAADFQAALETVVNPYGEAGASRKIVEVLKNHTLESILKKKFCDLEFKLA
jgi:GDP/UDP-N,N'-diacetylbacillosamine 2-epimerase (hydrolysing)